MKTRTEKALEAVLKAIVEGGEYPDVISKVARFYKINPVRLGQAYDDAHITDYEGEEVSR